MNDRAPHNTKMGTAGQIAHAFIKSKLTPLLIITSILLGIGAVIMLPREEEPQIKVPMIDVLVQMPGASAKEMEERVTRPMEKLLWEIEGVEYIYSTSSPGQSMVIVRFYVGEDIEESLVKLNQKLQMNYDRIPHGVSKPLIKPRSIDDVPILSLTLHSSKYDHLTLRRLVAQVDDEVKQIPRVAETMLIGGSKREVRVDLDPVRLAAYDLTPLGIVPMIQQANSQYIPGGLTANNKEVIVETGGFLENAEDVANVVVGVYMGKPVYLRQVADITDGGEEPSQYVFFGEGAAVSKTSNEQPAVTLTVAKRPGANAIDVADEVLRKVETLKGVIIPSDINVDTTRNYGETAAEKSNELLFHMLIAVFGVSALILLFLGWRESFVVAIAIPSTLALTLLVFYLYGYTLNRITLFALIFSIGILVDDAIVVIENIVRHYHLPKNRERGVFEIAEEAVSEVGNPTILATWAVIAAIVPMAFVGGLMGPYMRPIPIGASAAMFFSLAIAFIVTPWASVRVLRKPAKIQMTDENMVHGHEEDWFTRLYRKFMAPLISHVMWRWAFLISIVILLLGAMALVGIGWVQVKMLPFDNKSEFQVIINMPEGSALEYTAQAAREIGEVVRREPEVTDYQTYIGTAAPFNFNGLVRHYFYRSGANVADIQVNLLPKHDRDAQSHDVAVRVRPKLAAVAEKYNARIAVAEVPPGPPVLQTLVAEIYGPNEESRLALTKEMINVFKNTDGVVDTDWYLEADQPKVRFVVDKEKAALNGISTETISKTLRIAVDGLSVDLVHMPSEKEDVNLLLSIPQSARTTPEDLLGIRVSSGDANALPEPVDRTSSALVPLRELVKLEETITDKSIYHKNLKPVRYVIGDVAGSIESPVYAILAMNKKIHQLNATNYGGSKTNIEIFNANLPFSDQEPSIKWDGEWDITLRVFKDLGLAFAAVLILIYVLMVGWFRSFITPLIVMAAIPFSLVGIMPAHGLMDAFFTATSMIGFMAGAGIVVRNSIILVDFIELRLKEGMPLDEAVVDAGAVRFRPMLLTALAVVVGASVILADPIFQGLAIALMAGEIASLLISRMAVPVLYYMANKKLMSRHKHE
ncbi:MAG: efflux RND transporter permease subunit [Verrucomicrobia bacterium]|nr:efflux RND transporter permease subunit [Verrucomicrobiota bacterium]